MADLPTIAATERDPFKIGSVARQTRNFLAAQPTLMLGGWAQNVDLNSTNTDTQIRINPLKTYYYLHSVLVKNKGTTASITTATAGVFTAASAGGTTLAINQALSALTSNAVNTAGGLTFLSLININQWMSNTSLYFRVGTAQGAAATADVLVFVLPLPDVPMS